MLGQCSREPLFSQCEVKLRCSAACSPNGDWIHAVFLSVLPDTKIGHIIGLVIIGMGPRLVGRALPRVPPLIQSPSFHTIRRPAVRAGCGEEGSGHENTGCSLDSNGHRSAVR